MPYKYIGRTTNARGKTLWEIVGNLKNFGIGRIVVRNIFERYPEPSYYKILKVEPMQCPDIQNLDNPRKVKVTVEETFRGKHLPEPTIIQGTSYKADYKLIPKEEEERYCKFTTKVTEMRVFPKYMEFPPLLKELLIRERKTKNENAEEPKLEIVYNKNNYGKYRIADDDEKPNVNFKIGMHNIIDFK